MRRTSSLFRAAVVLLAVACGGKATYAGSAFADDAGTEAPVGQSDCFCEPIDSGAADASDASDAADAG